MNLKIVTAVHDRFDMTKAFCESVSRIMSETGVETYAVVTDGDECISLLNDYEIPFVEHENKPVGKKFNAVVESMRDVDFTHLMILGSDDIVSTGFIEHALTLGDYDYSGVDGLWFWGLNPRRAGFERFGYFPIKSVLAGTGKIISRRVVEACDYRPWPDVCNGGMDARMMRKTRRMLAEKHDKYTLRKYSLIKTGGFIVDVKYGKHISSMSPIIRRPCFEEQDPRKVLPLYLPKNECEHLFDLHKKATHWQKHQKEDSDGQKAQVHSK